MGPVFVVPLDNQRELSLRLRLFFWHDKQPEGLLHCAMESFDDRNQVDYRLHPIVTVRRVLSA